MIRNGQGAKRAIRESTMKANILTSLAHEVEIDPGGMSDMIECGTKTEKNMTDDHMVKITNC
jgi:hypothetical protein